MKHKLEDVIIESEAPSCSDYLGVIDSPSTLYSVGIDPGSIINPNWVTRTIDSNQNATTWASIKLKSNKPSNKPKKVSYRDDYQQTKDEYTLKECLDCYDALLEKDIADMYLTGSVALFIQGRISRSIFKDLDISIKGEYTLDDDIYDNDSCRRYPPDPMGVKRKAVIFNGVKIDLFSGENAVGRIINVKYDNKIYRCCHYTSIIDAKLRIVLPQVKDIQDLLGKSFEIKYI